MIAQVVSKSVWEVLVKTVSTMVSELGGNVCDSFRRDVVLQSTLIFFFLIN